MGYEGLLDYLAPWWILHVQFFYFKLWRTLQSELAMTRISVYVYHWKSAALGWDQTYNDWI